MQCCSYALFVTEYNFGRGRKGIRRELRRKQLCFSMYGNRKGMEGEVNKYILIVFNFLWEEKKGAFPFPLFLSYRIPCRFWNQTWKTDKTAFLPFPLRSNPRLLLLCCCWVAVVVAVLLLLLCLVAAVSSSSWFCLLMQLLHVVVVIEVAAAAYLILLLLFFPLEYVLLF